MNFPRSPKIAPPIKLTFVLALGASVMMPAVAEASPRTPTAASAPTAAGDGSCQTAAGVTVVVDFRELGGGIEVRCAANAPANGLEALAQTGYQVVQPVQFPGAVCRINGKPANDPCFRMPPGTAFWGYFHGSRGGGWAFSNSGAGNRTPPPGSVEGWRFQRDGQQKPPGYMPAPLGSQPTTPTTRPPVPTTRPQPPTTARPPVNTNPPNDPNVPSPPMTPGPSQPGELPLPSDPAKTSPTTAPTRRSGQTTTTRPDRTTTTGKKTDGTTTTSAGAAASDEAESKGGKPEGQVAADAVDASQVNTEDTVAPEEPASSPLPAILTVLGLGVVGAAGYLAVRRKRSVVPAT